MFLFYSFSLKCLEKGKEKASNFVYIDPYMKKPKMVSSTLLALNDKGRLNCPESYKKARLKDFLWIADLTCSEQEDVPMWVTWNARQTIKNKILCKRLHQFRLFRKQ